ncbi:toll-like receptor 4 [Magallana gigas]|uniref:toll-like receptor 4 n=1 Tax=Magallana gigas TaxID=29159 RepID=UPI00334155E8
MTCKQRFSLILAFCYSALLLMTENCPLSHKIVDDCGNVGLLWNCSGLNISKLPTAIPSELENGTVTLDLSFNLFSNLTEETFQQIAAYSNVTSVILHHNYITKIENKTFRKLSNLCSLDVSFTLLEKSKIDADAFSNLDNLKILRIHRNNFQGLGYPDIQLSKIQSLKYLKIDIFSGFTFSKPFENLKSLAQLEFEILNDFELTNASFQGLRLSPIHSINMEFSNYVNCDVPEDLFCSFPYLNEKIKIEFGGKCNVHTALKSLKCLQNRTIQHLDMQGNKENLAIDIVNLDNESFQYLVNICVRVLFLDNNSIHKIMTNIMHTTLWSCLNNLGLSNNDLQSVDSYTLASYLTLPLLQNLDLCCNVLTPRNLVSRSNYQNVLATHYVGFSVNLTLPRNLRFFDYSNNYIHPPPYELIKDVTIIAENLEEMRFAKTNFPLRLKSVLSFPSLKILDLSENDFSNINPYIFQGVKNIRQLRAVNVHLNFSVVSESLFKNLKTLTNLDISQNSLTFLPQSLLSDQKQSLEKLYLDHNMFSSLSSSLKQLTNLKFLYVRYNLISNINEEDQKLFESLTDILIYLEGNPISCTCSKIQSLKWMKDHQYLFADLFNTKCVGSKNATDELFNESNWRKFELDCQATEWLIFSIVLIVSTLITLIIIAAIKKYHVHLEYVILRLKQRLIPVGDHVCEEGDFQHDVYISYNDDDTSWVANNLNPKLESLNIKAWFKVRDSIPGVSQSEEIIKCINESRKVMFIISESFLDIGWSSYAVQMAITHAFHNQRQRSIVVIIKDGLPLERLPKEFKHIWWCIEHLRWPEDETNEETLLLNLSNVLVSE